MASMRQGSHGAGDLFLPVGTGAHDQRPGLFKGPSVAVARRTAAASGKPAEVLDIERKVGRKVEVGLKAQDFLVSSELAEEPAKGHFARRHLHDDAGTVEKATGQPQGKPESRRRKLATSHYLPLAVQGGFDPTRDFLGAPAVAAHRHP